MRIVSLLPSATEIVCALGAQHELVGVSHECDFPAGVDKLPALTRARLDSTQSSAAIDAAVREVLREALTVYDLDVERLRSLAPDVIVTQDLCDVCAVSYDDVRTAVASLGPTSRGEPIKLVNLRPTRLGDLWTDIERAAAAIGRIAEATQLNAALQARVAAIAARAGAAGTRPKTLTIEWLDPIMVGGTWMPELVELAGGDPLVTTAGQPAPTLTLDQLAQLAPDVVLIKPCGFSLARTLQELPLVLKNLPWSTWPACREGRVYIADGNAYFNRSGPRLVESLEILAGCVHPATFDDLRARHRDAVVRLAPDGTVQPFDRD